MTKQKLMAVLLTLAMTLTLLPTAAMAENEFAEMTIDGVTTQYNAQSEFLKALVGAVDKDIDIKLLDDLEIAGTVPIGETQTVTLDLNGHKLSTTVRSDNATKHYYAIDNYGIFTLKDTASNGSIVARGIENLENGQMVIESGKIVACDTNGGACIWNEAELTVEGGTFETTHVGSSSDAYGVGCLNNSGTALITGGTFDDVNKRTYAIISTGDITITPAKGKAVNVSGAHGGLAIDSGTAVVNGGSYSSTDYYGLYVSNDGVGLDPTKAAVTVNGGTFTGPNYSVWIGSDYNDPVNSTIEINGGTFEEPLNAQECTREGAIVVKGGTFAADPTAYLAAGYVAAKDNETNTWTVADNRVAEVNGQKFATLAAAIENAEDNDTITLLSNVTTFEALKISNKTLTLDLNKNTLKLSAPSNYVNNGSDVTVTNGNINLDDVGGEADCIIGVGGYDQQADSTLTLDEVTLTGSNYKSPYAVLYVYGSSILNVQDSKITLTGEKASTGGAIKANGTSGKINITNSTLTFTDTVRGFLDGTLTIKDSTVTVSGTKDSGLDNAINSTSGGLALIIDHSNVTISGGSGRGITLDGTSTAVVRNGSQVSISSMSEAGIRFKANATGKFTIEGCDYNTPNGEVSVDTIVFGENVDESAFVLPSCYSVTNNQLVHKTTHTPPAPPSNSGSSGSGSSSSSNTTTTTEKNPDGSTTTTTTNKTTGTVTEVTKDTDGTTTTVETKKDGTVTETVKTPDGTTGTVVTGKSGDITEVKATVASTAAKEAARTGEAVTLPVEVPAAKTTEDAPAVQITVPKRADSVKVEIPVENVTPGTVAVIVHEDGTEEIVATSVVTEDGVALTLDGSATVKIIDNSKDFVDVPETNVFYDEICALSAREIMVGKTDDTFDLYSSVTLNQIANVAGRITGAVDVNDFSAGIVWGGENGLATGNVAATRGDVLKALYAAAGSPVVENTAILARFKDAASIPADLTAAAAWAAQNGILQGDTSGNANLSTNVTRGQACALAGRTMGTLA